MSLPPVVRRSVWAAGLLCALAAPASRADASTPGSTPAGSGSATKSAAAKHAAPKPAPPPAEALKNYVHEIRSLEESGAYGLAADRLRQLRPMVPIDADLELALALDLARSGALDSAASILDGRTLTTALADTADTTRFHVYAWPHDRVYLGGRFEGWYWYIARARAEVAGHRGRWDDALTAARICTRARPLAGTEWHVRAVCAARAGALDEARECVDRAVRLSPILPEAHYLSGLLLWREGQRAAAQERFRRAIALDSAYREPALALTRVRLPVAPDSLPTRMFTGLRAASLLTSPVQPKYDEFTQLDAPVRLVTGTEVVLPESLAAGVPPYTALTLALVDAQGRVVLNEELWTRAGSKPEEVVGRATAALEDFRFTPAIRHGRPLPLWMNVEVPVKSNHTEQANH